MATSVTAKFRCLKLQRSFTFNIQSELSSVSLAQVFSVAPPHGEAGGHTKGVVGHLCPAGAALEIGWQSLRDLTWHQVLSRILPQSPVCAHRPP